MISEVLKCNKCQGNFLTIVERKGKFVRMKCNSCDFVFIIIWDIVYKKLVR